MYIYIYVHSTIFGEFLIKISALLYMKNMYERYLRCVYDCIRKYKEYKISRYTYQLESWNICDEEMSSGIFLNFERG